MREVSSIVKFRIWVLSPRESHLNPSMKPITVLPRLIDSIVEALMTPFIPGAGPPPTRIERISDEPFLWSAMLNSHLFSHREHRVHRVQVRLIPCFSL